MAAVSVKIGSLLSQSQGASAPATDPLAAAFDELAKVAKLTASAFDSVAKSATTAASKLAAFTDALAKATSAIGTGPASKSPPKLPPKLPAKGQDVAAGAAGGSSAGSGALAVLGGVAAAGGAMIGAFIGAAEASKKFVEAFNPTAIIMLNQALDNLYATIGYALEPVIQTFTGVIKDAAGILRPALDELRPVIEKLAQAAGGLVTETVRVIATLLTNLVPSLKVLTAIYQVMARTMGVFARVFDVFSRAWLGMWGEVASLDDVLASVVSAFEKLVVYVTAGAAAILKFVGLGSVLTDLIKAFDPDNQKKGVGRVAAPRDVQVRSGFDSIINELTARAFAAQGGNLNKDDQMVNLLRQIHEGLKTVDEKVKSLPQYVKDAAGYLEQILERLPDARGVLSGLARGALIDSIPGGRFASSVNAALSR